MIFGVYLINIKTLIDKAASPARVTRKATDRLFFSFVFDNRVADVRNVNRQLGFLFDKKRGEHVSVNKQDILCFDGGVYGDDDQPGVRG